VHDVQRKVECVPKENNMWVQEVGRLMLDHALFISKPALPLDKLLELIQTVMKASGNGLTISGYAGPRFTAQPMSSGCFPAVASAPSTKTCMVPFRRNFIHSQDLKLHNLKHKGYHHSRQIINLQIKPWQKNK